MIKNGRIIFSILGIIPQSSLHLEFPQRLKSVVLEQSSPQFLIKALIAPVEF